MGFTTLRIQTMETKVCRKCGIEKPLTEYSFKRPKNRKPGLQPRCKSCAKEDTQLWKEQQSSKRLKDLYYKRTYGMSLDEFSMLLETQQNKCKLCYRDVTIEGLGPDRAVVDHCHKDGHVRGILCNECNRALGYFHDNIQALENAVDYLRSDNAFPKKWRSPV